MKRFLSILLALCLFAQLAYAQKSFDMRYREAVSFIDNMEYDKAIKMLELAKKAPGTTKQQAAKADRLIRQCKARQRSNTVLVKPPKESVVATPPEPVKPSKPSKPARIPPTLPRGATFPAVKLMAPEASIAAFSRPPVEAPAAAPIKEPERKPSSWQPFFFTGINWVPVGQQTFYFSGTQNSAITKDYDIKPIGDVFAAKFKVLPGLSISAVQAMLCDINGSLKLSSISPLTNFEFRMGGGVPKAFDVSFIASGAWYWPWWADWLGMNYCLSGIDAFVGAELSSCLPVANLTVKAGARSFISPEAHGKYINYNDLEGKSANDVIFVITVGITIGTPNSRGQNLLRFF